MDKEKIIKQLENDAIATDTGYVEVPLWLFNEILSLLKKQEESKPIIRIIRKQCKIENSDGSIDYYAEWFCPHCKSLLQRGFDTPWIKYCYKCGKPITWGRPVK
jgi:hypothetical protein